MTHKEAYERLQERGLIEEPTVEAPAIPLRDAVEAINSYKAAEGDALKLVVERGRLKVKLEYGG